MADPFTMLLLTLAGGGLGAANWGLNQIPGLGPTTKNVNTAYKDNPIWQQMFGEDGLKAQAKKGMESSFTSMESWLQNALTTSLAYDPNAFWKDFMAAQPEMQSLISGGTDSFKSAAQANLADFAKTATAETASEMSGMGSLYSGAFGDIVGSKVGKESAKAGTDLASLQAGLMSQLWGSALPQFSGNRQFQTSNLVNTYMGGAQTYQGAGNTYSQQLMQMLGIGADLSTPIYQQTPGLADMIMQGLGLGLQGAGAYGTMGTGKKSTTDDGTNAALQAQIKRLQDQLQLTSPLVP